MKSSTNRALVAKKQSTSFAQVATNLLNVLQGCSKSIRLLLVMFLTLTASTAWGAEKIKDYSKIVTGKTYYIGATTGTGTGTDYYLSVSGALTSTSIAGTAVTTKANATAFVFTGSGTSWTIKFADYANYLGLKNSKDNGKVQVVSSAATFTASNQSGKLRLSIGSYSIQKNNSGTQFGSYGNTQTDIWLEEAPSHTITATSNNNTYGTVSVSGTTITATPNDGYRVKSGDAGYTLTSGTADVTNNGNNTFSVTPSSNCTVRINFEAIPTYTINWHTAVGTVEDEVLEEGATITKPATNPTKDGYEFMGWTEACEVASNGSDFTAITNFGTATEDKNYYAVFAKATTTGGGGEGKDFSFNITKADFNTTSYAANNNEKTSIATASDASTMEVKWTSNQVMQQSSVMQWQKNTGYIFNSTDLGTIKSIEITKTDGTSTTYYGTSKQPENDETVGNGYFQIKIGNATGKSSNIKVTFTQTVAGGSTTYDNYITTCAADPCASLQAPNVTATATANSITLSWEAVDGATSYNVYNYTTEDLDETTSLTYTFTGLSSETEYEWGVESAKGECFKETRGTTTTLKACTDAVTISKGTETNGTFTLSTTGQQSTCNGSVTVTLSNIEPATGYQFSAITQSGVDAAKVTIDNTAKTVTYAQNTSGTSTIIVTFIEIPKYTVTLNPNYPNGKTGTFTYDAGELVDGNLVLTYDYNTASKTIADLYTSLTLDGYEFGGWYNAKGVNPGEVSGSKCTTTGTITGNKTYYAKWSKLYSITLSENGTTTTPTTQTSTSYTLPTELTAGSCQDDTKELVGWSTVAIPNPGDKPTSNFYELGETVTLTADQTTFYAVFATAEAGGGAAFDGTSGGNFKIYAIVEGTKYYAQKPGSGSKISSTEEESDATEYTFTKDGSVFYIKTGTDYLTYASSTDLGKSTDPYGWNISEGTKGSWRIASAANSSRGIVFRVGTPGQFGGYALSNITANGTEYYDVEIGGGTTYSDYSTTCVKLPDPVLSFATEPANPIVFTDVACGGNSSKQSVTVVGENLRDVVEVSVTGPYKIARTASTALKDFTTSLTLDKTAAGAIHSNYQTVYIISTPPAQSTEATTGTLTFTTTKGNTLTVNLSTPAVTCTQYTLTLNDRGTKTTAEYYAGASVSKPEDPTGVCTDPIHYVFDGWAEATVTEGSTTYTKVSFPYTMPAKASTLYAVYRYLEGGGNGDYNLVTSALDDWSGDYLIAYSDQIFANGTTGGESGIGAKKNKVDLSSSISNNTIPASVGDQYNVTLEAVTGGYVLKTQDGKYNYHTNNTGNGISASSIGYADDYPITVNFVSQEEINMCLGGSATGSKFRYNTDGYFRFYKNGGQQPVYLYKKADGTTYYTTSPICGPHLAITEGKEIYVTGGNAGGTRDLVIAQQKVSYKATRLQTSNGLDDGTAPDVKVATNGITVGGVVTTDVKVTIDQTKEQQTDGTYTITGTITVQYQPSANNKQEDIQVQLAVDYNAEARDNFTVHARSLPAEFVIVAKSGDKWYALNGDMNTNAANPANGQVTLDDVANPTKATYAPCNTIYTFDGLPNTGDRTYVRFQGTDGAWLWASSGTNVGIQNNVLKTTPEGNNNAYNWKLETEDNITYQFGNANSNRQLTLSGEKFGMYASGVQDIRILPYDEKCLYNYAPTNLKVSVLKGTYVTLTWDAVAGATKYQYSTDATNWNDAGTEPTVTINGLTGDKEYTYYIRAYHEDAGVSQECIDYAEITFTTADCDDVPTDITYSADMNSIIVSWIANAATSTVNLYSDEEAEVLVATKSVASPCTFTDLAKNTQYYVQILANGTCASPIVPVKTEDVEVDIVEWYPQGIIVDINTDETVGVTLENEVSYGSGMGTEATELFFSKYYEASYNVKLVAIYNGTKNIIDLTDYTIQYGKTSWESDYITLKDFGATKGQIQPGEEIILYTMQEGSEDDDIMDCVHEDFPDGNWVEVTSSNNDGKGKLSFGGDKTIILCKKEYDDEEDKYYDNIIDVIGALKNDPNEGILPTNTATEEPSWGDKEGWVCETGLSIADDSQIGISTNRCLLIRNNTVTSGDNAVTQNIDDFVTLCTEWKGAHVPDNDIDNGVQASCDNFAYVGIFDYSDYYTKYVPMGEGTTFDENDRNADGTVTIPITDLYKHACSNIRVKLTNSNSEVLTDREYKVPIMITTTQGTDGQAFLALQENLATKEVDGEGNVINTYPLSLDEVREICKTCDVVVRDNATLTKVTDGTTNDHPQVRNVYVYEGASIVIPDGVNHNYTINGLSLRRKGDEVASAQVQGTGKFVLPADEPVCLDLRVDANNWHWFTLPYDCDIADVTWIDGTPAKYNTDWFLMYYDGESRAASTNPYDNHWKVYSGTTIEAGKGYIVGITGDLTHPNYTFELRFPMAQEVLTEDQKAKTVPVNAWGVKSDNTPNNLGWNLVGNPYLNYYKTADGYSLAGLPLIHYTYTDPVTGEWNYEYSGGVPYVVTPIDGGWYEYQQELASGVNMMPFTAYFVQVGDPETHTNGQALNASFEASNRGKKSIVRRAPREVEEIEEPIIVRVELTNSKGESDKTSLVIDNRFTNEYEMNGDFFKWFGDYYNYYTKPVLYTIGADQGKRAFNALNEELAKQPIPMGMYAAQAGNYTFSLNQQFDLSRVEEVWLYDATQSTYTNLMQSDYTFSTSKVNGAGRFSLSVKLAPKVATSIDNVTADKVWATTHTKQIIVNGLDSSMHLWLYDATGKLLYNEPTSNYQHTYAVPQTGTYFVSVMKGNAKQTIKVVVE